MKAVILAGGEGKRLRPITDNIPKPMVPIFDKPCMEHLLISLSKCGITEVVVTLHYMPEVITHFFGSSYNGISIRYTEEKEPRGTAGAVKDASKNFSEPFFIVSADAVINFDFEGINAFHKAAKSNFTVVCKEVKAPGEYGLVNKDDENHILSFSEKPGWNRTNGNLANTGVYLMNPEINELIPDTGTVDFASDIFPEILKKNLPFFAYKETGYWCDIGSPEAYKECHRAVFEKKANIHLNEIKKGVYAIDSIPNGNYTVIPPVYFGKNITVEKDAVIGPYTVIGDGSTVGRKAKIRKSVLLNKTFSGEEAFISDSIICSSSSVKKGCRIFENAVIGENTVIGENSTVGSNVEIASNRTVAKNTIVSENITDGYNYGDITENGTVSGTAFTELSPVTASSLGSAFGSVYTGKYLAVGCDGKNSSNSVLSSVCGGIIASGGNIWDIGHCFLAEFKFMLTYCGMNAGVYISTDGGTVTVSIFGEHSLAPARKTEREINYRFRRSDFTPCNPEHCGSVRDMSYLLPMYRRQLGLFKNEYYGAKNFFITSENERIKNFCRDFFGRHCTSDVGLPLFNISTDGTKTELTDEVCEYASYEKLLALCCYDEFVMGNDVAVPFDAPKIINKMAHDKGCNVIRYCDEDDAVNSDLLRLKDECIWAFDGLFMIVKILDMTVKYSADIHGLLTKLPVFFVYEKTLSVADDGEFTGEILNRLNTDRANRTGAGINIEFNSGNILLTASGRGKNIRILAEAENEETAAELCGEIEDKINSVIQSQENNP